MAARLSLVLILIVAAVMSSCRGKTIKEPNELPVGKASLTPITGCFQFDPVSGRLITVPGDLRFLLFVSNRILAVGRDRKVREREILSTHKSRHGVGVDCEPFPGGLALVINTGGGPAALKFFDYNLQEIVSLAWPPPFPCGSGGSWRLFQWVRDETFIVPCLGEGKVTWFSRSGKAWDRARTSFIGRSSEWILASCAGDNSLYLFTETDRKDYVRIQEYAVSGFEMTLQETKEMEVDAFRGWPMLQFRCVRTGERLVGWFPGSQFPVVVFKKSWVHDSDLEARINSALGETPIKAVLGARVIKGDLWVAVWLEEKVRFVRIPLTEGADEKR